MMCNIPGKTLNADCVGDIDSSGSGHRGSLMKQLEHLVSSMLNLSLPLTKATLCPSPVSWPLAGLQHNYQLCTKALMF